MEKIAVIEFASPEAKFRFLTEAQSGKFGDLEITKVADASGLYAKELSEALEQVAPVASKS